MTTQERAGDLTREMVLKALSDDEIAIVSNAESADRLSDGDEYLDLGALEHGVMLASGEALPMNRVLPRKAVHESTWRKLVVLLAPVSASAPATTTQARA